jgi:predicted PurR-regulated permease PerM
LKETTPDQSKLIRLWTRVIVRVLIVLIGIVVAAWLLYALSTLLLLLVISIFFCYMIAPLVRLFEQPLYFRGRELKMPRGLAILFIYVIIGFVLFFALQLVWPVLSDQIKELGANLPAYIQSSSAAIGKTVNDSNSWVRHLKLPPQWRDYLMSGTSQITEGMLPWLRSLLFAALALFKYLPWLILVPILSFFLLKDAAALERAVVDLFPNERLQKRVHWLLLDVSRTLAAYIRAQLTACVEVGTLVTIGLGLIGAPYAVVVGAISGLLEFIPMIGPFIAALIAFSLTLTVSFKLALVVAAFLAALRIAQDYIIYPRIVGHGIRMHPLVVIIAILGGAEIGGLVGVFLSIPFVGLIIVAYNHYLAYRGLQTIQSVAQSTEPELAPSSHSTPVLEK